MKIKRLIPLALFSIAVLGGCTLAFPEAPMNPDVAAPKPVALKTTEVCDGTFAADTESASGDTILSAAKAAGITKITSIQYESKNYIFFVRLCAVVKGT